jgi:glycosyltransferase involved in cell wall biosynthesis
LTKICRVGVCICTRNRPRELANALASLMQSTVTPDQILVSDDSDSPRVAEVSRVCHEFPQIEYVSGPRRGLGANRNTCLDNFHADIDRVCFVDDDVRVDPHFVERVRSLAAHVGRDTILTGWERQGGVSVMPRNSSFLGHQTLIPRGPGDYHCLCINATAFPADLFRQAQFDPLLRYGNDETDICAQAESLGYRIMFDMELVNDHDPSPVNRDDYVRFREASRLYSTFKRYRWLERKRLRTLAFALVAPVHLLGSSVKSGGIASVPSAALAIREACRYVAEYRRTMHQGVSVQVGSVS